MLANFIKNKIFKFCAISSIEKMIYKKIKNSPNF